MADQVAVEESTHRLAEAELEVLRDHASELMLEAAAARLRSYDPARNGRSEADVQADENDRMIGAAEVYGALRNEELRFSDAKGLPPAAEHVQVAFTERAMAWLRFERDDIRHMLAQQRGTIEICEYVGNLRGTRHFTFLLFVLDGIFAGEEVA